MDDINQREYLVWKGWIHSFQSWDLFKAFHSHSLIPLMKSEDSDDKFSKKINVKKCNELQSLQMAFC